MSLAFGPSLHYIFQRLSEPVHDFFAVPETKADVRHQMLVDCYLSGQMTDADLDREISSDPFFEEFLRSSEKQFH